MSGPVKTFWNNGYVENTGTLLNGIKEEAWEYFHDNGKLRAKIIAPVDSTNQTVEQIALADEKIKKFTDNKELIKVIVVPNKLINIVTKG